MSAKKWWCIVCPFTGSVLWVTNWEEPMISEEKTQWSVARAKGMNLLIKFRLIYIFMNVIKRMPDGLLLIELVCDNEFENKC